MGERLRTAELFAILYGSPGAQPLDSASNMSLEARSAGTKREGLGLFLPHSWAAQELKDKDKKELQALYT